MDPRRRGRGDWRRTQAHRYRTGPRATRTRRPAGHLGCDVPVGLALPYKVCGESSTSTNPSADPAASLSFPNSSEAPAADGVGTRQVFLGGTVYYSPATGAYIE